MTDPASDDFAAAEAALDTLYDQCASATRLDQLRLRQALQQAGAQLTATRLALFERGVQVTSADLAQLQAVSAQLARSASIETALAGLGQLLQKLKQMG